METNPLLKKIEEANTRLEKQGIRDKITLETIAKLYQYYQNNPDGAVVFYNPVTKEEIERIPFKQLFEK